MYASQKQTTLFTDSSHSSDDSSTPLHGKNEQGIPYASTEQLAAFPAVYPKAARSITFAVSGYDALFNLNTAPFNDQQEMPSPRKTFTRCTCSSSRRVALGKATYYLKPPGTLRAGDEW